MRHCKLEFMLREKAIELYDIEAEEKKNTLLLSLHASVLCIFRI